MRVAAAAYPLDVLSSWEMFEHKAETWVKRAATNGAELLVFPEYGAMELATLAGLDSAGDLERSAHAVSDRLPGSDALFASLAQRYGVHILTPSGPAFDPSLGARPVNRARLIAPNGLSGCQDKQIMTPYERDPWQVVTGRGLTLFDTALGKIGVLICYDSEFPLLARALVHTGADLLLVPSCTETLAGYWRVRIGAMARALEGQCVSVMSSVVGPAEWNDAVDQNTGAGGVFAPPDIGFPETGVLAAGQIDTPGWTFADIDMAQIAHVRAHGGVRNASHWAEQEPSPAKLPVTLCSLR